MTLIAQYARFPAKPGRGGEVLAALDRAMVAARREPGTLVYTIHVQPDDPDVVWMYELYASADAQAAHSGSEATAELRAAVSELLEGPLAVTRGAVHAALEQIEQ